METQQINRALAQKVLSVVDVGLSSGLGKPIPGEMCVEAAVCYAMGLPHDDKPICVAPVLRNLKIALNDKLWSSRRARAKGLRRLAIAQLGSAGVLDEKEFLRMVVELCISKVVPKALRKAAKIQPNQTHKSRLEDAARVCEVKKDEDAAYAAANAAYAAANAADAAAADAAAAAYAAANAAYAAANAANAAYAADAAAYAADAAAAAAYAAAARDSALAEFAEDIVQILIKLKAPGCEFLDLTE